MEWSEWEGRRGVVSNPPLKAGSCLSSEFQLHRGRARNGAQNTWHE